MVKVLLIEDDGMISKIVQYYLKKEGSYDVTVAQNAGDALYSARDHYDIILLDILLPDVNGIELCERLRTIHNCPILFISALDDSDTIVSALRADGDDFITKPFDNKVLEAKIQAQLRRSFINEQEPAENTISHSGLTLDASRHMVRKDDKEHKLVSMEFRLLSFFMQNPNRYFTANELYKKVWGRESHGDTRTVIVHIHNLRKKFEDDPSNPVYLQYEWGSGYIFNAKANRR